MDCLLENAVRFTAEGDRIEVCCRRDGEDVVIGVSDTGAGIPPDDLTHVFDAFHRGTNAVEAGTGLGLSIVRRIVESRGGTVEVTSQLGTGTTFTLRVPVAVERSDGPPRGVIDGLTSRPAAPSTVGWPVSPVTARPSSAPPSG